MTDDIRTQLLKAGTYAFTISEQATLELSRPLLNGVIYGREPRVPSQTASLTVTGNGTQYLYKDTLAADADTNWAQFISFSLDIEFTPVLGTDADDAAALMFDVPNPGQVSQTGLGWFTEQVVINFEFVDPAAPFTLRSASPQNAEDCADISSTLTFGLSVGFFGDVPTASFNVSQSNTTSIRVKDFKLEYDPTDAHGVNQRYLMTLLGDGSRYNTIRDVAADDGDWPMPISAGGFKDVTPRAKEAIDLSSQVVWLAQGDRNEGAGAGMFKWNDLLETSVEVRVTIEVTLRLAIYATTMEESNAWLNFARSPGTLADDKTWADPNKPVAVPVPGGWIPNFTEKLKKEYIYKIDLLRPPPP
jgi:hypothetical protein